MTAAEKMMKAIVFTGAGKYEYTERPEPCIQNPTDVKLRILGASICGTDVAILDTPPRVPGVPGIILGHECVGEVVETGDGVFALQKGDHVILDNNLTCGVCPNCQTGNANLCTNMRSMGVHIDGVFAQYAVAPERRMVRIAKEIPLEEAIFAEPLNCVTGAIKKLKIMPGDTVLVLGGGPIGLYFTTLLRRCGAGKVLVSEVSDFRTEYAVKQGADRVINPKTEDLLQEVLQETNGRGADIVIDAVGCLLPDAIRTVKASGSILLFGQNAAAHQEIVQNDITARGLTVYGNFIGNCTLQNVANVLNTQAADFSQMITHRLPLREFGVGLEAMREQKALEVILYPFED